MSEREEGRDMNKERENFEIHTDKRFPIVIRWRWLGRDWGIPLYRGK